VVCVRHQQGVRLPLNSPEEDRGRPARPPWLSSDLPRRGVGYGRQPDRDDGDAQGPFPGENSARDTDELPRVDDRPRDGGLEPADAWEPSRRHRVNHGGVGSGSTGAESMPVRDEFKRGDPQAGAQSPTPRPVNDPAAPEFDEIEARAARLAEQIASRRAQKEMPGPQEPAFDVNSQGMGPVDPAPSAPQRDPYGHPPSDEYPAETPPAPARFADSERADDGSESVKADPVEAVVWEDTDADDTAELAVGGNEPYGISEAEQPTATKGSPAPINRPEGSTTRRMALPPWQIPTQGRPRKLDYGSTSEGTGHSVEQPFSASQQHEAEGESRERPPESSVPPPRMPPPVQPRPFPPPPGFVPPPGWWPPPPPPPGWPPIPPGTLPPPAWQGPVQDNAEPHTPHRPTDHPARPYPAGGSAPPQAPEPRIFRRAVPPLDEADMVNRKSPAPESGWRRAVHKATGGRVNPGDSPKQRAQEKLLARIRQPIVGDFRIAVLSIKGGVGKTTTTMGLGSALAMVRRDRVIAMDANPDRGTLAERVSDVSTGSTVRDLLAQPDINRYADVRVHTRMAPSRLEVLASEQDPAASEIFGEAEYRRTIDILGRYYNVVLTDCGTGIMHSAMAGVLDLAHSIVLVSSPAMDALRSASATLDWLMQHGHSGLVQEGYVVLSAAQPGSEALDMDKVRKHFEARCRSVHLIPYDPHLGEGADVDFAMLNPATAQAYLELAGAVAENFPRLRAPGRRT
jgi:MinD-like ATPase involved in chromosome partitioning or flagellar assembly